MGDQNPMAYVHKGGVRILSYLIYAVREFRVLPFIPSASKDHSALYVFLTGMQPCYSTLRPKRQRVIRPEGAGYLTALSRAQGRFAALLDTWQTAAVPVSTALQQFLDLLVSCAEGQVVQPRLRLRAPVTNHGLMPSVVRWGRPRTKHGQPCMLAEGVSMATTRNAR
jgi:hypothetical protein